MYISFIIIILILILYYKNIICYKTTILLMSLIVLFNWIKLDKTQNEKIGGKIKYNIDHIIINEKGICEQ